MTARFLWILAFAFLAGCGGVSVLPEPFTRERADGKIPVKVDLIREQVRAELDGTPEGEAEVARWQAIETDYNQCRLSSARATKSEAEEVFSVCMSERGYVYMFPIDAEQFHSDIAFELEKERDERLAAEKKAAEEAARKAEDERLATEKRLAEFKKKYNVDNDRLLEIAAQDGDSGVVRVLLAAGANPNARIIVVDHTALMLAAQFGHAEVVKILLAGGAHPNAESNIGFTALILAALDGHTEIVKILLAGGAEVNQRFSTALYYAEKRGFSEIVRILELAKLGILPDVQIPKAGNTAEGIFANVWRSVVVINAGDKQGSGVIVRPNVVATNCHVVDGGGNLVVSELSATIRKRDDKRDFCLLNVAGLQGDIAKVRRYKTLNVGENVYGLGAPQGLDLSLSSGIISQLRQSGGERFIQTDAAISPGSSGGGLFDSGGNLIGIMTFKIANENVEGIGFAIPADLVLGY